MPTTTIITITIKIIKRIRRRDFDLWVQRKQLLRDKGIGIHLKQGQISPTSYVPNNSSCPLYTNIQQR